LPSAGVAGVIAAVLMTIPLGGFGLGMLASGTLSVIFYRRRTRVDITAGAGAKLGAVTGLLGFSIFAIFTAAEVQLFHKGGELRALLIEAVRQTAARSPDAQSQQVMQYLQTPAGLAVVMGLGLAVMLVAFLAFSSLGGALGAVLFRRKNREI
jgi:hypothetical protein